MEDTPGTVKLNFSNFILNSWANGSAKPPKHASTCKSISYWSANWPNFEIGSIILCAKDGAEPTN